MILGGIINLSSLQHTKRNFPFAFLCRNNLVLIFPVLSEHLLRSGQTKKYCLNKSNFNLTFMRYSKVGFH
jgi:hypothetical protein